MKKILAFVLCVLMVQIGLAQKEVVVKKKDRKKDVLLQTSMGDITLRLSDSTPLHRDNFLKLVKQGFYDSILFHRVINQFMIQAGDPDSKHAPSGTPLGEGGPSYTVPAEFRTTLFHKKGALAMARTDNPEKASSNCQFYIVEGTKYDNNFLNQVECGVRQYNPDFYYNDAERKAYQTVGGTPQLDQNYTVFGEVIQGLDVIGKIISAQRDENDRPLKNIRMKMRMLN